VKVIIGHKGERKRAGKNQKCYPAVAPEAATGPVKLKAVRTQGARVKVPKREWSLHTKTEGSILNTEG